MASSLYSLCLRALLLLFFASPVLAHERWVKHGLLSNFDRRLFETFNATNLGTLLAVLILAGLLLRWSAQLGRRATPAEQGLSRTRDGVSALLGILTGVGLLLLIPAGQFVAPDLVLTTGPIAGVLRYGTAAVGAMLLFGFWTRLAGLALLGLYLLALCARPFEPFDGQAVSVIEVLNYFDVVGIALFLTLVGRGPFSVDRRWRAAEPPAPERRARAVGLLRITLGLTLVLLGVQKFVVPELPMGVVQNYGDQIYEPIASLTGVSPVLYVFAASVVETSVGLLVLMGVFTRVWIAAVVGLFAITATIFRAELLGHLPLAGIALVLLVDGAGAWRLDRLHLRRTQSASLRSATTAIAVCACLFSSLSACNGGGSGEQLPTVQGALDEVQVVGAQGFCRFELSASPQSVPLGEFFTIRTRVIDLQSGAPLTEGALQLAASMPEHGHGMLTLPRTEALFDGAWRTSGCKLHMYGRWVFELEWQAATRSDSASFEFTFAPPHQG